MGLAFDGTGDDLGQIIDTSNSFIETANANFDTTTKLIKDSNTVLKTQLDSASSIRSFTNDLALFSTTVAGADPDLRNVIDSGSVAVNELRTFIEENKVDLSSLINNLVTTGEVVVKHLDGIEQLLVLYPYVVEGGFTVVSKEPGPKGRYNAHFGMVTTDHALCHRGYEGTDRRPPNGRQQPQDEGEHPLPGVRRAVQRPWRAERPAGRRELPGTGGRGLRPGHQEVPVDRRRFVDEWRR